MDLSEFYPSSADLIRSEIAVLNYLRDNPYVKANHEQLALDARKYHDSNRESNRHNPRGFVFKSYFEVRHEPMHQGSAESARPGKRKPNVRLAISARIELENEAIRDVTYSLAVCRIHPNRLTILRKFNFDVTVGKNQEAGGKQQRPQCHLQYCGTLVPHGCRQSQLDQMHPWLSEPRIFFWPVSLALLIDMALHEFPDVRWANFRESPEWRSLVGKQEALLLRRFYEKCGEVLDDKKGSYQTLAKEFYVY